MNRTKIESVKNPDGTPGYTWNPMSGCSYHVNGLCKGGGFPCWAYGLANGRLKARYLANSNIAELKSRGLKPFLVEMNGLLNDPFYPRIWPEKMWLPELVGSKRKPKGIFACDMADLFGVGVPEEWTSRILDVIRHFHRHRFYLLTKQPQNLIKFSPFPDNCWVGVTATNLHDFKCATIYLHEVEARTASKIKVKYISLEPLLSWNTDKIDIKGLRSWMEGRLDWLIIGAQTKPTVMPKIEWVQGIVDAADKAGVPVFLKDSLNDLIPVNSDMRYGPAGELRLRQEMPK